MKTVDKALSVLDQFSIDHIEIGLSELARMAHLDKAATRRLLVAMSKHGFIEQSAETRKYRLGQGFLRLARIREATVPVTRAAQEQVDALSALTNETVHASVPGTQMLISVATRIPNRARVIVLSPAEPVHYHATASGLVFLAFASDETAQRLLALKREKFTEHTLTGKAELQREMKRFRAQGYSQTHGTYEADVSSIAVPFGMLNGDPVGVVALAASADDMTDVRRAELLPLLQTAAAKISAAVMGA